MEFCIQFLFQLFSCEVLPQCSKLESMTYRFFLLSVFGLEHGAAVCAHFLFQCYSIAVRCYCDALNWNQLTFSCFNIRFWTRTWCTTCCRNRSATPCWCRNSTWSPYVTSSCCYRCQDLDCQCGSIYRGSVHSCVNHYNLYTEGNYTQCWPYLCSPVSLPAVDWCWVHWLPTPSLCRAGLVLQNRIHLLLLVQFLH